MSTNIHPEALAAELAGARQTHTVHAVKTGDAPTDLILLCLEATRSLGCQTQAAAEVFEYLSGRFSRYAIKEQQSAKQWQQMAGGAAALGNWKPPEPEDGYCPPPQSSPSGSPSSIAALGSLFDGSTVSSPPLDPPTEKFSLP